MVNTVYFVLPPNETMASSHVRAVCLADFAPEGWSFKFITPSKSLSRIALFRKVSVFCGYVATIAAIKEKIGVKPVLYFIKPASILLIVLCRFVLRWKIFIDVNDPVHLPEHLGRLSKQKFILMLKISTGVIFESPEYEEFTRRWRRVPAAVIEDTPQFDITFVNYNSRNRAVVWFGSPSTSRILLEYVNFLEKFQQSGYEIILVGVHAQVESVLNEVGIVFKKITSYTLDSLIEILSASQLAFVPMLDSESHVLRGNLKAKLAMAAGCITIASESRMHRRLIQHGVTGFLFSDYDQFVTIVEATSCSSKAVFERIGSAANVWVISRYKRASHAKKITDFIESCGATRSARY
jgi:glycosyltransferase involved in cell wall biosynthesis